MISLSLFLSVAIYLILFQSIYLSVLFLNLSIYLSIYLSISFSSNLSICLQLHWEIWKYLPWYTCWYVKKIEKHSNPKVMNLLIFFFYFLRTVGLISIFANGPEDLCSIPGRVIPKTQKCFLMVPCLTLRIIR